MGIRPKKEKNRLEKKLNDIRYKIDHQSDSFDQFANAALEYYEHFDDMEYLRKKAENDEALMTLLNKYTLE